MVRGPKIKVHDVRVAMAIIISHADAGRPIESPDSLTVTLRDLLLFMERRRCVTTEYSAALLNRMFVAATAYPELTPEDILAALEDGIFAADWHGLLKLAWAAQQEGGSRVQNAVNALREAEARQNPPASTASPKRVKLLSSTVKPRAPTSARMPSVSPRSNQSPRYNRGSTRTITPRGQPSSSQRNNSDRSGGRFLPTIEHPKWSVHSGDEIHDGMEHLLVDDMGRTMHEVDAMRSELHDFEVSKARPNDHGIVFCSDSKQGAGAVSAVIVDVGHSSQPKFHRTCNVGHGPSHQTIADVVGAPSKSPRRHPNRPLTVSERQQFSNQARRNEEEAFASVLAKVVNYFQ